MSLESVDKKWVRGRYLYFHDIGQISPIGKTRKFEVRSIATNFLLGFIKWYPPFRKYSFFVQECILDDVCMMEIISFCRMKTQEHKDTWKKPKHRSIIKLNA